ncbi:MAG: BA14K family protein [Hyphomicrobiales bacterium]|nr:BA14K family protein [Hyphomicrobiales bacterium]
MKLNMKKAATALILGTALVGTSIGATTTANATHKIGHAIVGGVIGGVIGGAIVNSARRRPVYVQPAPVYSGLPRAHYNWCYRNYRSYHQPSNTFQPYNGPRRPCHSPWW